MICYISGAILFQVGKEYITLIIILMFQKSSILMAVMDQLVLYKFKTHDSACKK